MRKFLSVLMLGIMVLMPITLAASVYKLDVQVDYPYNPNASPEERNRQAFDMWFYQNYGYFP